MPLKSVTSELVARWQADQLAAGAGPSRCGGPSTCSAASCSSPLSTSASTSTRPAGPRARLPRREEVQPLAPITVERLRAASDLRDATLFSVMAYAGLRPGEALGLRWGDVREQTLLVQRSIALGADDDTKTSSHRSVRLLAPLRTDLVSWSLAAGRPGREALVFPSQSGAPWSLAAYQSWRRRSFDAARTGARAPNTTPYTLRHSFASLLLHEGRSVVYVARQTGHGARLTLSTYGHVIDELEDQPRVSAEEAIRQTRAALDVPSQSPRPKLAGTTLRPREHRFLALAGVPVKWS